MHDDATNFPGEHPGFLVFTAVLESDNTENQFVECLHELNANAFNFRI